MSARPRDFGRLVFLATGGHVALRGDVVVVGRSRRECDVELKDPSVSSVHCIVRFGAGKVTVEDLGSLNGTWVNGVRVQRCRLKSGDSIEVGLSLLMFEAIVNRVLPETLPWAVASSQSDCVH